MQLKIVIALAMTATTMLAQAGAPAEPRGAVTTRAVAPAQATGVDLATLSRIDGAIGQAIADKQLPGAVVLIGRGAEILYQKAYGNRALEPAVEPATLDTIYDMASLTKVVATTTSVMMLVEQGRIRLTDRVATFIPDFGRYGKGDITVRHLLTHVSGLRPDVDLGDPWVGYDNAIALAAEEVPTSLPGERFVYSDINFFLLAEIVARVSGEKFDRFARQHVFTPLGMVDTMFNPPEQLRPRIAPTQMCTPYGWPCEGPGQVMLRGIVHDPTARRMAGVAGHAGLFSTAADLSRFARMILGGGALGAARILAPLTVAKMTSPASPTGMTSVRGLGWDIDTSYSSNRGELMPVGSFGHTGFTGTSLWIDPLTRTYIIFLSNRVHPDGRGDVTPLRARVATVVASALRQLPAEGELRSQRWTGSDFGAGATVPRRADQTDGRTMTGIDVLRADGFKLLQGKRVGLITNPTGRARTGEATIDLLASAKGVQLVALFSPEHGIRGILDEKVASSTDEKTGLPIYSLYGATMRPSDEMLKGIDTLVLDLQDIGARFYTYTSTMAYVLEEAAKRKIAVVVLDRPNPINGVAVEGPALGPSESGFTAYFPAMPVRHAMTLGELAKLFNAENTIGADLTVVEMTGWSRDAWFDYTGLPWVNPSPNMRNLVAANLYPGIGAIEASNLSVGRGTDTPFEQLGAPWIDGPRLAAELNRRGIAGVRFYPIAFTPTSSKFANERCQGVFIIVTDRERVRSVRVGLEVASALYRFHPAQFNVDGVGRLFGADTVKRIKVGENPEDIVTSWARAEAQWRLRRAKFLMYR
ncbi:MAG: exo-beta-N-acetylmuramidase NamZ domain-containing protein [Acidobacteriota bacterium]